MFRTQYTRVRLVRDYAKRMQKYKYFPNNQKLSLSILGN